MTRGRPIGGFGRVKPVEPVQPDASKAAPQPAESTSGKPPSAVSPTQDGRPGAAAKPPSPRPLWGRAVAPQPDSPPARRPVNDTGSDEGSVAPRQSISLIAVLGLTAMLLQTLSLSPLGWGLLAFLVGTPLAWLVLDARRLTFLGYATLYLAAVAGWLILLAFEGEIPVGSWSLTIIQIAWFSAQLPAAVGLGRVGRRVVSLPTYIWLPVVWCALEYLRGTLGGGFEIGLLGHAVADSRRLIQIADLVGSYGLGAIMIACGSTIAEAIWLLRRLRRLEKAMPPIDPAARGTSGARADQSDWTAAALSGSGGPVTPATIKRPAGRAPVSLGGQTARREQTAEQSLRDAVRRTRDQTRDRYLLQSVAAFVVLILLLLISYQYGDHRNGQTAGWKLFEKNLYELRVHNGPGGLAMWSNFRSDRQAGGLTIVAMRDRDRSPAEQWPIPQVDRGGEDRLDLWRGQPGTPWSIQNGGRTAPLASHRAPWFGLQSSGGRAMILASDSRKRPINVACQVTDRPILESLTRRTNRSLGDNSLDVVIVVIDRPGQIGSAWPRLLTRSALAAAVANRTAVIGILPGATTVIATGEGKLLCSALRRPDLPGWLPEAARRDERQARKPLELGEIVTDQVVVSGMFDPRRSFSLRSASVIPQLSLAMAIVAIARWGWTAWTRRRRPATSTPTF